MIARLQKLRYVQRPYKYGTLSYHHRPSVSTIGTNIVANHQPGTWGYSLQNTRRPRQRSRRSHPSPHSNMSLRRGHRRIQLGYRCRNECPRQRQQSQRHPCAHHRYHKESSTLDPVPGEGGKKGREGKLLFITACIVRLAKVPCCKTRAHIYWGQEIDRHMYANNGKHAIRNSNRQRFQRHWKEDTGITSKNVSFPVEWAPPPLTVLVRCCTVYSVQQLKRREVSHLSIKILGSHEG